MPRNLDDLLASDDLPSLPAVALQVIKLVRDPDVSAQAIVEVLKSDPALVTKLLRTVNSPLFGLRQKVNSIEQTVALLGGMVVNSVVLSFSLASDATRPGPLAESYQWFWRSALVQAVAAETVATRCRAGIPADFFVAGLIQDIGVLVLLRTLGQEYAELLAEYIHDPNPQASLVKMEQEELGFTHVDLSVGLLERWGLDKTLVQAVAEHHQMPGEPGPADGSAPFTGAVQATAATIGEFFCRKSNGRSLELLKELGLEVLQISEEELTELLESVDSRVREQAELYSFDIGRPPPYQEILASANTELTRIVLHAQLQSKRAGEAAVAARRELQEVQDEKNRLEDQAQRDPLTGTHNRLFFDEALGRELCHTARLGSTIGLLFLDIDRFKAINDTYGHAFGDRVLCEVTQVLQASIRGYDIVARYGGDEFVIMVPQTTREHLAIIAERIRKKVELLQPHCDAQPVRITVSIGAAVYGPQEAATSAQSELLEAADHAMYHAKRHGRNQIHLVEFQTTT